MLHWHTWHAQLADYIISCNAHFCGLQVTLGPGLGAAALQCDAHAWLAFMHCFNLICKLEQYQDDCLRVYSCCAYA